MTPDALGCDVCRDGWFSGRLPRRVGLSIEGAVVVFHCDVCGTYWFQTERYAAPVSVEEARRTAPDVMLNV